MTNTWTKTKDSRIKKRGEVYWARFTRRGQEITESLGTRSFDIAKKLVDNIEQDILLGVNWRKERELFETAWSDFLEDKAKGIKTKPARPKTLKEYVAFGERHYLPNFGDRRLSELEDAWDELVQKIRAEKPNIQFDNIRKYLMGFASWAYAKGKIKTRLEFYDPDVSRKAERQHDSPGLAYSAEELASMLLGARRLSPRFYLFMLMAQYMGMRPGEISQLKKDRIDLGERVIRLRKADTKTARARVIPIHREVLNALCGQMDASGDSPYLFPNMHDKNRPMDPTGFKKFWQDLDPSGRVYDFRHTFITNAMKQGLNPSAIAMMTGTSLKMVEQRYLHFSVSELASEMAKFRLSETK